MSRWNLGLAAVSFILRTPERFGHPPHESVVRLSGRLCGAAESSADLVVLKALAISHQQELPSLHRELRDCVFESEPALVTDCFLVRRKIVRLQSALQRLTKRAIVKGNFPSYQTLGARLVGTPKARQVAEENLPQPCTQLFLGLSVEMRKAAERGELRFLHQVRATALRSQFGSDLGVAEVQQVSPIAVQHLAECLDRSRLRRLQKLCK